MSVKRSRPFLLLTLALFVVCVDAQGTNRPCESPRAPRKIPVLILDRHAKTPERAAEHWRRTLRHRGESFPLEITAYPAAENLRATGAGSLMELGVGSGAALVLARAERKQWLAVVVQPRADDAAGFLVPTVTRVREKSLKQFVRSFIQYFSGDYVCALDGFEALARKRGGVAAGDELDFWIGSTLAQLGQTEQAVRRFRQAAASNADAGIAEEFEAASSLAVAQLLLPEAQHDRRLAEEVLALLEKAARGLRGTEGRYWTAAQVALGRYWLSLSGATSVEGLRRARSYFESAEFSLVLPRDESDAATLHALMAVTELQMAQAGEGQEDHLQKALDHFTAARAIWRKRGDEADAEAASQQIRSIQEARRRRGIR